jgi:hypothetical protein
MTGWDMKRTGMLTILMFIMAIAASGDDMAGFKAKAVTAGKILEEKEGEYIKVRKDYDAVNLKIQELKKEKEGLIRNLKLSWYLGKGNSAGYRLFRDEKEIKELKDDYFTYSALVLEDYNRIFFDCLKAGCRELTGIYAERKPWAERIINFSDVFRIEISIERYIKAGSSEAAQDIREYLRKKLEQADQRIFMLAEEKNVEKEARTAGIEVSGAGAIDAKIAELKELKKSIRNELKK